MIVEHQDNTYPNSKRQRNGPIMIKARRFGYYLPILFIPLTLAMAGGPTESKTMSNSRTEEAITLMNDFAQRTGLTSKQSARRYLWTDAFAVCNFLGLAHATGEAQYRQLALRLIEQVHHTLGRHRNDDPRSGWISGLSEREGESHPTRGGLRIGKELSEHGPDEPFDERLEWERDGQYFHYLAKWMHALDQMSRSTSDPRFNTWARELAKTAHDTFVYQSSPGSTPGMYWKMSIDLTRPLVPSMGQHDPLDGYITSLQLRATADGLPRPVSGPGLEDTARQFSAMTAGANLTSPDPLGIGGLLSDAYRVWQLMQQGERVEVHLLEHLLTAALAGLEYYAISGELQAPAEYRLAFRELGLAIGLHAVQRMWEAAQGGAADSPVHAQLEALMRHVPLGEEIESFWRNPRNRSARTWSEHRDINEVMLATSLAPDGFLVLHHPGTLSR